MVADPVALSPRPIAPTASLPPLARLSSYSTERIQQALANLRSIYISYPSSVLAVPAVSLPKHVKHNGSVPDSGYASAEEDEDEIDEPPSDSPDETDAFDVDILRSDAFEREFVIRWLTAFAARSDAWVYDPEAEEEEELRVQLVDEAASLLTSFVGDEDEEDALTRTFSFPIFDDKGIQSGSADVELNDAPLLSQDHTSVGLQSWGSSILFAERICAEPRIYDLFPSENVRVLELGAGTGMLSIAVAKLWEHSRCSVEIVATDYHQQVLENLQANVQANFISSSPITVLPLDWQSPAYNAPLDDAFNVILAADVIYHPDHASWIKACVSKLLRRPSSQGSTASNGGVFWLIIPVRSIGRHEGMADTVEAVFRTEAAVKGDGGSEMELAIRSKEDVGKHTGIGRADETYYRLFKIGWVEP